MTCSLRAIRILIHQLDCIVDRMLELLVREAGRSPSGEGGAELLGRNVTASFPVETRESSLTAHAWMKARLF